MAAKERVRRGAAVAAALLVFAAPASATHNEPLRGQWHLDEPQCGGGTCLHYESSGHDLTGTEAGAPQTVPGRWGNALRFPARTAYVSAGNKPLLQPANVSVVAWVRAAATPPTVQAILSQGANGNCSFSSSALYTGGSQDASGLRFYIWNGT